MGLKCFALLRLAQKATPWVLGKIFPIFEMLMDEQHV
jgi:hypothetical protein